MIIFCGIQAAGKSTFYKERFFNSHVRISLDLLNTRNKELIFLKTCLQLQQRIVIDNTNPTKLERKKYIELARQYNYQVTGYFFQSKIKESIERNNQREGKEKINEKGIAATSNKLEIPSPEEGFDTLYFVSINPEGGFSIQNWQYEI